MDKYRQGWSDLHILAVSGADLLWEVRIVPPHLHWRNSTPKTTLEIGRGSREKFGSRVVTVPIASGNDDAGKRDCDDDSDASHSFHPHLSHPPVYVTHRTAPLSQALFLKPLAERLPI